jgi:N-methylhydantoinase A
MDAYLSNLETRLRGQLAVPIHIMQSNGGVMTSHVARGKPVQTLFSGPVGGAIGVAGVGAALGVNNLIGIDMGGTSFDVSVVVGGVADQATQLSLQGHPILTPMVKIHTIGAGGGSLVWTEGGGLRVGPRSAGADPGPACYARGGLQPTVTDANVVLGRIDPDSFLGGRMHLDAAAAAEALERLGAEIGLTRDVLAEGVCRVVNANMANAIRSITVQQGLDPREFVLVAFGGAGPMHALFLAQELEMQRVIVPPSPGTFSASGMLQTNIQHDVVQTMYRRADETTDDDISVTFATAEARARTTLGNDGVPPDRMRLERSAEMRYVGQEYAVQVPFASDLAQMANLFHGAHEARYGHSNPQEAVEFVNLRVTAIGGIDKPPRVLSEGSNGRADPPVVRMRGVIFDGAHQQTAVYARDGLMPGSRFVGPAIVEEPSSTTVIPPGYQVAVDALLNLEITAQ